MELPEPQRLVGADDFGVRMMGIGGTGVVTVNQVLGMAALIDGLHVSGLDQTGLSPKGGPVISDLRITREPLAAASKAPAGSIDLYLGFDLLGAASAKNLVTADRERTARWSPRARCPPGRMVVDTDERFPSWPPARQDRRGHLRPGTTSTSTPSGSPSGSSATT